MNFDAPQESSASAPVLNLGFDALLKQAQTFVPGAVLEVPKKKRSAAMAAKVQKDSTVATGADVKQDFLMGTLKPASRKNAVKHVKKAMQVIAVIVYIRTRRWSCFVFLPLQLVS